ncbi:MAG TPA: DolP-mannose mannosyltransferase [Blastocatellia bacterium]|nr:DolP-mannose mannosyltransferase [Blastocatellia bacterium]
MSTQATEATGPSSPSLTLPPPLVKLTSEPALLVMVFVFGAALMLFYRPFSQLEGGDSAIYDYIAQSILRGQVPYRDVVDIKGPASVYLSAAAVALGRLVGLHDVIAIRLFHVLMVGLLAALTFRVGVVYLRSRLIGVTAALLPFVSPAVAEMLIGGTQPKLPLVIFGLASLLLVAKDRPFWSGLCGMLACLCWQPGLMFVGTAFLIFSRYLTSWRDLRAAKVVAGAVVPLAVVALYFAARGALGDLWSYAMVYNYSVFGPEAKKPVADAGSHLWKIIRRVFDAKTLFLVVALGGLAAYMAERAVVKFRRGWTDELWRDAVIFPALVYLVFAFINFQAGPDLIPFLPFIGLFAAWLFAKVGEWSAALAPPRFAGVKPRLESLVSLAALAVVLALVAWPALRYRVGSETLQKQIEEVNGIASLLQPDDAVYSHGTIGMLVLMNRANMNPYVFLDWDMDTFIAARKYGGSFQALIDEMEARKPKLVGMSRLRAVTHGPEFEQWLGRHYEELPLRINKGVYVRKPD